MGKIHYPHQTYLKLDITLKFCQMEQEPPMISDHMVVHQEKCTNMGLVQPLVIKFLFVVHLLDLTLQN